MKTKLNAVATEVMEKLGVPLPTNFDPDHNPDHLLEAMGAVNINVFFVDRNAFAIPGEDLGGDAFEASVPIESGPNAKSAAMKLAIYRVLERVNSSLD